MHATIIQDIILGVILCTQMLSRVAEMMSLHTIGDLNPPKFKWFLPPHATDILLQI